MWRMSAVESALDVLSRAATMVQEERPKATNLQRRPSSSWRKDRRRDPIQSEALDMSAARAHCNHNGNNVTSNNHNHNQHSNHHHSRPSVIVPTTAAPQQHHHGLHSPENPAEFLAGATTEDTAVTPTASVTPSASRGQRTGMRTAGVASDPAIDEHFKRSLGLKDYAAVFNAATTADKETGLSVDDHFAKALGETWTRLQATSRSSSKDST